MQNNIAISLKPDWDKIEDVRNRCAEFLNEQKMSGDDINALIMVVSELVENAIKYGSFTDNNENIEVKVSVDKNIVIVEVQSPVDDKRLPYLRHLDETIQWIRGYQDPFETYIIKLRQIASKPMQDAESGLGLVRISYEGQSILDFIVSEDNKVSVSAVYRY